MSPERSGAAHAPEFRRNRARRILCEVPHLVKKKPAAIGGLSGAWTCCSSLLNPRQRIDPVRQELQ
ncbi:MAG TPA: hypothetical protein VEU07_16735, partial [Candidatus Acidoferrum sp.]|nr:hypothetical protein [Candidatus Acidoferrum sp.]